MNKKSVWTHFWDMHSGGNLKEKQQHIFIEAPKEEAIEIFERKFGHHPERITCSCCGEDYAISEEKSLKQATGYHRNCKYGKRGYLDRQCPEKLNYGKTGVFIPLEQYLTRPDVLVLYKKEHYNRFK